MYAEIMPEHNISPSTRFFFPHKERYEIFDGNENLVEKIKIFVQDSVPIRTALTVVVFYLVTTTGYFFSH